MIARERLGQGPVRPAQIAPRSNAVCPDRVAHGGDWTWRTRNRGGTQSVLGAQAGPVRWHVIREACLDRTCQFRITQTDAPWLASRYHALTVLLPMSNLLDELPGSCRHGSAAIACIEVMMFFSY